MYQLIRDDKINYLDLPDHILFWVSGIFCKTFLVFGWPFCIWLQFNLKDYAFHLKSEAGQSLSDAPYSRKKTAFEKVLKDKIVVFSESKTTRAYLVLIRPVFVPNASLQGPADIYLDWIRDDCHSSELIPILLSFRRARIRLPQISFTTAWCSINSWVVLIRHKWLTWPVSFLFYVNILFDSAIIDSAIAYVNWSL